ncbi:MAG: peptidase zinc-dependent [Firmicutes bacterium]|nr:peptidase zinc-dependent [Bacillota bacterium]
MKIGVFTIGEVDLRLLYRLICCLEERFLYKFLVSSNYPPPASAFNAVKKQYFAPALMNKAKLSFHEDVKYSLGITRLDLYSSSLSAVFGDANLNEKIALTSYYRLSPKFYAYQNGENPLFDRLLKEAVHQLSHILGLKHCYNRHCVLYYSSTIYDIDQKSSLFCADCEKKLKKAAAYDRTNDFHA